MPDWPSAQGGGQRFDRTSLPLGTSYGVTLTANASANTKGSWVELHSATNFPVVGIMVTVVNATSTADRKSAVDIGIGAGGSETVLIADIVSSAPVANMGGPTIYFPLRIPQGSRLSARVASSGTGSPTTIVHAVLVGAGFASDPGFSRVTTYLGATSPDAVGVDPGATINTAGAWATVSTSVNRIKSLILRFDQHNTATTAATWRVDVGIGATPDILIREMILRNEANYDQIINRVIGPIPVDIPAGVALKLRAACTINDATDRVLNDCSAFGLD